MRSPRLRIAYAATIAVVPLAAIASLAGLLARDWFSLRAGQALEVELTLAYALMTVAGLAMTFWFFAHVRGAGALPGDRVAGRGTFTEVVTES